MTSSISDRKVRVIAFVVVALFHFFPSTHGFFSPLTTSTGLSTATRPLLGRTTTIKWNADGRCTQLQTYVVHRRRLSSLSVAKTGVTKPGGGRKRLLVGNLASNLSKLLVGPKKAKSVSDAVTTTVNGKEVMLIAFCAWALSPLCRFIYNKRQPDGGDFKNSKLYKIPRLIEQMSRIAALVYAIDVTTVVLDVMGFKIPRGFNVCAAKIMYLLYASYGLIKFKKHLLIEKTGKAGATDKLLDALIGIATAFGVLDILSVQMGMAMQSIFALGGAGTIVVSLGSENLASQIVNGLAIVATGKYYKGEKVVIDDKYVGTIERMNLMATEIRGGDENILSIPNKQLSGKRVGNITRSRRSSVSQTVWFKYEDIDKIPQVCEDIKKRIKERCPMLEEKDRPFRSHWRDFKRDHLEVGVQAHFRISPYTNAYYENRQEVLFAIADAAKENNVKFDIPTLTVKASEGGGTVGKMLQELKGDAWQPNGS